ncbi:MAG: outer membrane lipoprotein-sorting protein [Candidatus Poribacteria bacterium]|nr:outer membrane lipoprotein-sorting protein [Candidatus Poribacteria bacterium]
MEKVIFKAEKVRRNKILCFFLVLNLAIYMFAPQVTFAAEVEDIIKHLDQLYRSKTSHADIEMQIVTPHWERTLSMTVWTKGVDKTFIRITAPKKEKGLTTLRIGKEMWNYLPKVNKTFKISPSMMMGSWMGSDFTNDDLVRQSSMVDDYTYQLITPEDASPDYLYVELIPKEDTPIVWGKIIAAVQASDYLPVWQHFYDEKDKLMRIMNYKEIKKFGGKTLPSVMEMVPTNKEGHKTVIRFMNADFDSKLDDKIFTRRNLQKR